jgi:pimeloyl-ACP methyl ester carboxylesterase
MAYYEWGNPDNNEVVVCVHGLSRNGRDFDVLAQALAPHYRVICPDIAGRGKSSWLENKADYSYATYLADMSALLLQLHLSKVTWLGTSMGGILGMMIASSQPALVQRMVLNDVGSVVSAEGLKRILGYVGTSNVFADKESAMQHLRTIMKPFGIHSEPQWQHMFAISFTALPDGTYTFAYDPAISQPFKEAASTEKELQDIDLSMFWNAVQCPVLILRGEDSDILSAETAQSMCKRAIATDYIEIEGAGHAPALMDDYQVSTVCNWIEKQL